MLTFAQNRQPWQRSMSHPNPPRRPLQPVSEATKTKLNKFQYQSRNDSSKDEKTATPAKPADENAMTPNGRLSWRDLLEPCLSTDDEPTHPSPNDRLLWDNRQDPHYLAALSPMLSRGKKRARSSSPVSSPAADHPTTPAINVQKLAQALRTPNADPTLELWDRYSFNGHDTIAEQAGITNPALAQLMVSSSPTPTKRMTPGSGSGPGSLRKAISAGLTWTKRRKIEKSRSAGHVSNSQRELEAASKSSLVSALLDTVSSSIHEPSPRQQPKALRSPSRPPSRRKSPKAVQAPPQPALVIANSSFSDFDDDELDDDTFMELEASMQGPEATQSCKPEVLRNDNQLSSRSEGKRPPGSVDEFGDLDDAVFEGAETLAGVVTQRQPAAPPPPPPGPPTDGIDVNLSEDEFSDGFDADMDLDAMEFAATQTLKKPAGSVPAVC